MADFVISSFRVALFRLLIFSLGPISSFRLASFRSFAWRCFGAKRRKDIMAQTTHHSYLVSNTYSKSDAKTKAQLEGTSGKNVM